MPLFSLLVRVKNPIKRELHGLLDSLEAQTNPDWELVLVVDQKSAEDQLLVQRLSLGRARVRSVLRPDDELLAWSCNLLLPTLGTWTGFLDQHDRLVPEALATMAAAIQAAPQARVIYSDECHRDRWDRFSFITTKGAFDSYRLVSQEYLGSLTLLQTAHLQAIGGFDRLASDVPTHDLYLRTFETQGPDAFRYVPAILCRHYRNYLEPRPQDIRLLPHLVRYDLFAIRQHLTRTKTIAQVRQEHGTVRIDYHHSTTPGVHVWVLVGDDQEKGTARMHALNWTQGYRLTRIQVLHQGTDPGAARHYQTLAKSLGWDFNQLVSTLPSALNQALPYLEHDWVLVLDGLPINHGWLLELMNQAQLPRVGAVGARCTDLRRIVSPGLLGYIYDGWDWNTRGRFNRLQVPHQTGALGSGCLLFNARTARELNGFREDLPTLWAMDFSLRVDQLGLDLVTVPSAHIQVDPPAVISTSERTRLETDWAGWEDRFGLHLPI